jgi:aryl-alcohol dehydrogenase-like predicted oxidoreductase
VVAERRERGLVLPRAFGATKSHVSAVGLGCSRLASILGPNREQAERLIRGACDLGVNFFDTADIYGQGDSERLLGLILPRTNVMVATKVGQRFPPVLRALKRLKRPLAPLLRSSPLSKRRLYDARSGTLSRDFRPTYIRSAVEGSLKRLRRDRVDVLFLHGPSIEAVRSGEQIDVLLDLKRAGKANLVGLSCDDIEVAIAAFSDARVDAVQCRLSTHANFARAMSVAAARKAVVVAREIFGGVVRPGERRTAFEAEVAIRSTVANPYVTVTPVGTTQLEHLAEATMALERPLEATSWS